MNSGFFRLTLTILAALAAALPACAQEIAIDLDPAQTTIRFTLEATMHTVHGSFRMRNGGVGFNRATGSVIGSVVIDATSGETGNRKRDRNMHRDVLMSERYPEITFTLTRIVGTVALHGESSVQVEGVLRLLGNDHPITLPVKVQANVGELHATTHFTVPYVAWGLKNPSTFLLHVADKVELDIVAAGRWGTVVR